MAANQRRKATMSRYDMALSLKDDRLFDAVERNNDADAAAAAVRQAIRNGANVNAVRYDATPLMKACGSRREYYQIIRVLLEAGADARWRNRNSWSAITQASYRGHLSTVKLLLNHESGLLEMANNKGWTPLLHAVHRGHGQLVQFLLDCGADVHHVDHNGETALMHACQSSLEIVRLVLDAGADVEARDEHQKNALHHAVVSGRSQVIRELIFHHNANIFAVDRHGRTPFDLACVSMRSDAAVLDHLLEMYGNILTQDHGSIALHELLKVAEYSFGEDVEFHPPLDPLQIILPLGKLRLKHLRTLLHTLVPELRRDRDNTGKLPIHIACQTNAPVEVLALILKLHPAALRIADSTRALPIHLLCGTTAGSKYASVRYLVEQGGVGTLTARDNQGLLPLHVLCRSTNPPLRAVQYLIQSLPGSVAVQTNAGLYPFMMAAADASSASLSVIYELVRASTGVVATTAATPATASAAAAAASKSSADWHAREQLPAYPQLVDLQRQLTHLDQRVTIAEREKTTLEEQIMIVKNQNRCLLEFYQGLLRQQQPQSGNTGTKNKN